MASEADSSDPCDDIVGPDLHKWLKTNKYLN